jgi:hypothetical protein
MGIEYGIKDIHQYFSEGKAIDISIFTNYPTKERKFVENYAY